MKAAASEPTLDEESSDEEEDRGDVGLDGNEADTLEPGATSTFPVKAAGITDGDWRVYRAIVLTKREFDDKFKAMWA